MNKQSPKLPLKLYLYGMVLLSLAGGCSSAAETPSDSPDTVHSVQVEQIVPTTDPLPVYASGVLASKSEINLSFKVGGYIDEILIDEGEAVKKGDLLARLDLSEINAKVIKARNAFEKAKRDLERIRNLYQDTVVTLEQVQDLETVYEVAQAELKIARYNKENAKIYAPINGRILNKYTETEEQVSPGRPILQLGTFGDKSQVIKSGISDEDVVRVQIGDTALVKFDALGNRNFKGEVNKVAAAADPQNGTFEIEVMLSEQAPEFRNGFVGKVTIFPTGQSPYLRIPMSSLVEANAKEAFIYVPADSMQIAQRVAVNPFYIGDSYFAINVSDLGKYSQVITRGSAYLGQGSKINIVNEEL